jgi:hypothetical protein
MHRVNFIIFFGFAQLGGDLGATSAPPQAAAAPVGGLGALAGFGAAPTSASGLLGDVFGAPAAPTFYVPPKQVSFVVVSSGGLSLLPLYIIIISVFFRLR